MLLWKNPGEQRSGFFFGQTPDTFSKRTTQFRGNTAHQGQTHAVRNNPSYYLGASAYRGITRVALCGRLGSSAGRHSWRGADRSFDPCSPWQDLNQAGFVVRPGMHPASAKPFGRGVGFLLAWISREQTGIFWYFATYLLPNPQQQSERTA
jgi:hypothetical protein